MITILSFKFTLGEIIGLIGIVLTIIGIILGIFVPQIIKKNQRIKKLYRIIWKKSLILKPIDIFGSDIYRYKEEYPYNTREIDSIIKNKILSKKNILIVGRPLAGKTRTIYQNLKELKNISVLVPNEDFNLDDITIPKYKKSKITKIIVLDNLNKFGGSYFSENGLRDFIYNLKKENIQIIASCRSGFELQILKNRIDIRSIIDNDDDLINLPELENEQLKDIAKKIQIKSISSFFDGTIGSLILPLQEMENRYSNCTTEEKNLLTALKMLYLTGINKEKDIFSIKRIKDLCNKDYLKVSENNFQNSINLIENKEFINIIDYENVRIKDVYLEKIAKSKHKNELEIFNDIIDTFSNIDSEALFLSGRRAHELGIIKKESEEYFKISINAYKEATKISTLEKFPEYYALIQNNLGNTYERLTRIRDKRENCIRAIDSYNEALRVRTIEKYPRGYAETQHDLGNTYAILSEFEDTKPNCLKAIEAFNNSIKIITKEKEPLHYALMLMNMGNTYANLAAVEERKKNYNLAINNYKEALKIFLELKEYPIFAVTINNLSTVFTEMAIEENNPEYCYWAIHNYQSAFIVYKIETSPLDYANTKKNLGDAYMVLAKIDNQFKKENCNNAIDAYNNALKIYTLESFPLLYANILNSLGGAYSVLYCIDYQKIYVDKAIDLFNEALKVFNKCNNPYDYAKVKADLGIIYLIFADLENKQENLVLARDAFIEALKIINKIKNPIDYLMIQKNIGIVYTKLATLDRKKRFENCSKAIIALNEVLGNCDPNNKPLEYAQIQHYLGTVFGMSTEIKNKKNNYEKAINALNESLRFYNEKEYPQEYFAVKKTLGLVYITVNEKDNLILGINTLNEVLKYYKLNSLLDYAVAKYNIGKGYMILAERNNDKRIYNDAITSLEEASSIMNGEIFFEIKEDIKKSLEKIRKLMISKK